MNIQDIKELAKIMQETGITSLHLTEGALDISMERNTAAPAPAVQPVAVQTPVTAPVPEVSATAAEPAAVEPQAVGTTIDFNHITEVKSPMVGVFYAAPSPDAQPYVQVGSKVKKGDVLCIIEAMKLMNEITAEQDGEIVDICVQSGQVVEYSQTLFKIF
mgnify:FL=1|jgi:acetyl-CoA carboxylase biotin carboxyl carrier protein